MRSSPEMLYLLNFTINHGQPLAAKKCLAAKGCPGFVVKFDTYNNSADDPILPLSLQEET